MMLYFFFLAKFILWCFSIFAASVNGIFFPFSWIYDRDKSC